MYEGNGIGLAGPQVGINEQLIVVDIGTGLYKLVNPRITKKQGRQSLSEGCLSIPGICIKVKRANKILVRALDEEGVKQDIEAEGLLACVLQHEIDHLKGRIIIDYASIIEKFKIKKTLKELKKKVKCGRPPSGNKNTCQLEL
jgi:peptide deformylase